MNRLLIEKEYDWNMLSDLERDISELIGDPEFEAEMLEDSGFLRVTIEYIKDVQI